MAHADTKPTIGVRALWPYLRRHRPTLLTVAALSLVSAGAALATPLLTQRFIDGLSDGVPVNGDLALLVTAVLIASLLDGLITYLLSRTAGGVVLDTRVRLVNRLLRLPIAELNRRRTGDLMSRVGADTTLLSAVVTSGLVQLVSGMVVVVGAVVLAVDADSTGFAAASPFAAGASAIGAGRLASLPEAAVACCVARAALACASASALALAASSASLIATSSPGSRV